jgi:putative two-component system response regulator
MTSETAPLKPLVLVVDDVPQNLSLMDDLLTEDYTVKLAPGGVRALNIARNFPQPDLILLDVVMPEMDGYEVCRQLKADPQTRNIPVIFVTSKTQLADEQQGFAVGAVDYIFKPISPPIVLARVRTHLALKHAASFLRNQNEYLETEIVRRTQEVHDIQDAIILAMTSLAETRDNETGNHLLRTQRYVRAMSQTLSTHPRFADYLNDEIIELLYKSTPLHDIGKVGIPDRILLKPGRLDAAEFDIMKTHTTLGRDAIDRAMHRIGRSVPFLEIAAEIALSHQEKWDGSGYPQGLAGDAIPVSARLMAVGDVYDALISRRVYKAAMPHEQAVEIIAEGRNRHFDPDMVDAFLATHEQFRAIANELADDDDSIDDLAQRMANI